MKLPDIALAACMAALTAASAHAAPMIEFVDNLDGSVSLQVVTDASGSLGAELAVAVESSPGLQITGATINTALFDDANPGDSPFIPGVMIGGDVTGLDLDLANNRFFAAYGAGDLGIGSFEFASITYEGVGTINAFGLVAQAGALNDGLTASIDVIPEPTTVLLGALGLIGFAARPRV